MYLPQFITRNQDEVLIYDKDGLSMLGIFIIKIRLQFAILHEYTQNTERENNTDVYASHQTKYKKIIR